MSQMTNLINPDLWNGRRVLLTGHTGFKGGWLALALRRLGAKCLGYSLPAPTEPSLFGAIDLPRSINHRIGDIRDLPALSTAMQDAAPEVVFHLAAQPIVRTAFADPIDTLSSNVMGTANLLEAVRHCPSVRALVIVTSDKVYDNQEWAWPYRENDRLGGKEPYGVSKACCEMITEAYRHSYLSKRAQPVATATVRAGNIFGGGDWAVDRLVPDAMRAFSQNKVLMIRNPKAVRPWQHVCEPVRGYLALAQRLLDDPAGTEGGWNFGPSEQSVKPVDTLVDGLCRLWGGNAGWALETGAQPYEARHLTIDSSRAITRLGWSPRWDFEQALDLTVAWYRAYYAGTDIADLTARQLDKALFG